MAEKTFTYDAANFPIGVTPQEFDYLRNLTGNIQTQLDGKAPVSHTHTESDITDLGNYLENLVEDTTPQLGGDLDLNGSAISISGGTGTANQLVISNGDGTMSYSSLDISWDTSPTLGGTLDLNGQDITAAGPTTISSTEVSYLDGVTSNIQTQLNGKANASHTHVEADITDLGSYLENVVEDTTPQLGGTLDFNSNALQDNAASTGTANQYLNATGAGGSVAWQALDISHDTSPQLGGDLDMNGNNINAGGTLISPTEMSYLNNAASNIQDQIDGIAGGLFWQEPVIAEQNDPPGSPTTGDRYIVGDTPTGQWSTDAAAEKIAEWNGSSWDYGTPDEGWAVWDQTEDTQKVYNAAHPGGDWVKIGSTVDHGNLGGLGDDDHPQYLKNLSEDTTPELGGTLDLADQSIQDNADSTGAANTYLNATAAGASAEWIALDISHDTSPTLGGNLDMSTFNIEGVTATEIGYVSGVTSSIQTQLNGKAPTSHTHTEADITDLGSYLENVVEDTTPQLGGDLALNGNSVNDGTGTGADQQVLVSDGAGGMSWADQSGGDSGTVQGTDGTRDIQARLDGAPDGNARGEDSVDLQTSRTNADEVASGVGASLLGGSDNKATAINSFAGGEAALADLYAGRAQAGGSFSSPGDAQTITLVARNQTTDATVTELFLDGTDDRIVLPNDTTSLFEVYVVGRRTDVDGESAGYRFAGVIDRQTNAASTALVDGVSKDRIEDTAQWDADVSADTTNGSLKIEVTGQAAKNINWVAFIRLVSTTG